MASSAASDTPAEQTRDETTQSLPPSHVLQDGRFVYLPEPTDAERARLLERSIARHGLLKSDGTAVDAGDEEEANEKEELDIKKEETDSRKEASQPTIHPLAVASARLETNGIAELSKAINLAGLVSGGDYFGLTNIVNADEKTTEDQTLRSQYIGKRKRLQFEQAAQVLERQSLRMAAAVTAQSIMDERLFQLRPNWRLVAPEHGTRAMAHAVRPSEVVAIDVDVYDRDRTGGGVSSNSSMGRIARRVPRYATIELQNDYNVKDDTTEWKERYSATPSGNEKMEQEETTDDSSTPNSKKTKAEPFAVADPTLGKIDVDFDADKIPMLTLQFVIQKPSTGFLQSARLSPLTAVKEDKSDENVVVSLQHSLFCASLFESIRRELVPVEDQSVGSLAATTANKTAPRTVWLSSENDENFLPPPTLMAGDAHDYGGTRSLSIIHCHEGEVMVQLDSEYSLRVKLVEAETGTTEEDSMDIDDNNAAATADSGSQSPQQLHALCRALLLQAQSVFHDHSIKTRTEEKARQQSQPTEVLARKKEALPPARILESCVNLGAKMIFEQKIRRALSRVRKWLKTTIKSDEPLIVEWLSLSTFDLHSQFRLCFLGSVFDASVEREEVTVTCTNGGYREATYHADAELELFLKMEIRRLVRAQDERDSGALTPTKNNLSGRKGVALD